MVTVFDLEAERARREATEKPIISIGGTEHALPAELPIDVFTPFLTFTKEASLLLVAAKDLISADNTISKRQALDLIVDLIASRHDMPAEVLQAVQQMARKLFGDPCYEAFLAARPSINDIKSLVNSLTDHYGVSLGESTASSESSADAGETSSVTSSASTDSTPEVSGGTPETGVSSGSAA